MIKDNRYSNIITEKSKSKDDFRSSSNIENIDSKISIKTMYNILLEHSFLKFSSTSLWLYEGRTTITSDVPFIPKQLNSISKCLTICYEISPPLAAFPFNMGYISVNA